MARCWIGTSGWSYKHWEHGVFYPSKLKKSDQLEYYCRHFDTVELNASFYRLPRESFVEGWVAKIPEHFAFTVKLWRAVTHYRRLVDTGDLLKQFFEVMDRLGDRRGPLLIQLAPGIKHDDGLLVDFLQDLRQWMDPQWKPAMEFRHKSWLHPDVYQLLDESGVAIVVHDMRGSITTEPNQAEFVYVRRHGATGRYAGKYTEEQLSSDAAKIASWMAGGRDVFVYFNNDTQGFAVQNAARLRELVDGTID